MTENVSRKPKGVFESKHTRERPPHLNDKNFSSTQAGGPADPPTPATPQPSLPPSVDGMELESLKDLVLQDSEPAAIYAAYQETDSTLSAGTLVHHEIWSQLKSVARILDESPAAVQQAGLTSATLQTLDHGNKTLGYHRDLAAWCQDRNMLAADRREADLTDSMLMPQRAQSQATELTGSSWSRMSDIFPPSSTTDTAEDVSGAGAIFHDIARSPHQAEDNGMEI